MDVQEQGRIARRDDNFIKVLMLVSSLMASAVSGAIWYIINDMHDNVDVLTGTVAGLTVTIARSETGSVSAANRLEMLEKRCETVKDKLAAIPAERLEQSISMLETTMSELDKRLTVLERSNGVKR